MAKSNIYVGIDLHKEKFDFVMLSLSGDVIDQGTCSTEVGSVSHFASYLTRCHQVVLEPLQNSFWFIDQLRPYAGSIHLAHSGKVRLIAASRLKNDRIDARILADLLRVGYLPEVYIPNESLRRWRFLIRHHIQLVRDCTRLKNRVLGMVNGEGYKISASDPFGKKGRAQLDSLALSSSRRMAVDSNLITLDLLSAQLVVVDKEIEQIAKSDETACLLCTIDGISFFGALAFRAFVGDMARFRSPKAFAAYTGLVPSYRQSAETTHHGAITKQGNATLRWVLAQAVTHAVRRSPYLKRLYYRLCYRSSVGEARTAVAHALARIIYHVWREARPYYR
jgi:transposase